jgi:PHP family Zn ribbon phosphoesterase
MLKKLRMDLHIHTCLSPCADFKMMPTKIVKRAKWQGLDVIGICDHNSSENVQAVKKAGIIESLKVIGGVEVTSREEVHILTLFEGDEELFEFQKIIYENLHGTNNEKLFGEQVIVNEQDKVLNMNKRLLIGATELSINEIVEKAHSLRGLVIASHVDRERFSIMGQLGFIPEGLLLDGLEVSSKFASGMVKRDFYHYPLVTFSDAHTIEDIGQSSTTFIIDDVRVDEIKKALSGEDGRSFITHFGHC